MKTIVNNTIASVRYYNEVSIPNNVAIWHYRLGHANLIPIHNILALCDIHLCNNNSTYF